MKKLLLLALAITPLVIISCTKDEGISEEPTTINLAKHWFVRVQGPSSTSNYSLFSTRTSFLTEVTDTFGTQNQRMLKDTITLDDHNLLVPSFRSNVKITVASRTFGEGTYKNWSDTTNKFILKEGKIIKSGGKSKTGKTVDSIYLKYTFQSAPGTEYILTGHERTGLQEDEYF
jgi:hypothetical protein